MYNAYVIMSKSLSERPRFGLVFVNAHHVRSRVEFQNGDSLRPVAVGVVAVEADGSGVAGLCAPVYLAGGLGWVGVRRKDVDVEVLGLVRPGQH